VFLPEAIAHLADQKSRVTAPTLADAAKEALKEVRSRPGMKGRHFTTARLTVSLIGPAPNKTGQLPLGTAIDPE
jgi:hypothetical protein